MDAAWFLKFVSVFVMKDVVLEVSCTVHPLSSLSSIVVVGVVVGSYLALTRCCCRPMTDLGGSFMHDCMC